MADLFLAGQIIGTTGYEEAGSLGIMAGINAARRAQGRGSVVLRRDQAYIGVLIDDLVTKEMDEPYRMHTSQAEFRLLLRQDSAEERLAGLAHELGLIDDERHSEVERRKRQVQELVAQLDSTWIAPSKPVNDVLRSFGCREIEDGVRARALLSWTNGRLAVLQELGVVPRDLVPQVASEVETTVKYAGYVARQESEVTRLRRLEDRVIPSSVDYEHVHGLRSESKERLSRIRPSTIGQAGRIAGVAPSDISVLLVHLERNRLSVVD
jgi:tRNA uridine 5-carboxymethylaminomethyl modification enzyme